MTFLDSCTINPVKNLQLANLTAETIEYDISVDIRCAHADSDDFMNLVQITNESGEGNAGHRFFAINLKGTTFDFPNFSLE